MYARWAFVALLLAFGPAAGAAAHAGAPTPVDACGTIETPGAYVLTTNLTAEGRDACLRVLVDDVVLDGAGHVVRGSDAGSRHAVVVRHASKVTVRDLETERVVNGVTFWNVTGGRIDGVTARQSARMGIWLVDSRRVLVADATAELNAFNGIRLDDTVDSRVLDATVRANGAGIALGRSRDNVVRGNLVTANNIGIELAGARESLVAGNRVEDNEFGIVLAVATGNTVADNAVYGNGDGIRLDEADRNLVRDNQLVDNAFGIYLGGASGNTLRRNAVDAREVGIELTLDSDDNTVAGNVVVGSVAGIRVTASAGNDLDDNVVAVVGDETASARTGASSAVTTGGPTASATARTDDGRVTATGPGFGVLVALLALLAVAAALGRRKV